MGLQLPGRDNVVSCFSRLLLDDALNVEIGVITGNLILIAAVGIFCNMDDSGFASVAWDGSGPPYCFEWTVIILLKELSTSVAESRFARDGSGSPNYFAWTVMVLLKDFSVYGLLETDVWL